MINKGIIYKIVGYGKTYYGHSISNLEEIRNTHIKWFKERNIIGCPSYSSSFEILKQGDDWNIILLEEIEYEHLNDLFFKEQYYKENNL
jgi:hypothetical protein